MKASPYSHFNMLGPSLRLAFPEDQLTVLDNHYITIGSCGTYIDMTHSDNGDSALELSKQFSLSSCSAMAECGRSRGKVNHRSPSETCYSLEDVSSSSTAFPFLFLFLVREPLRQPLVFASSKICRIVGFPRDSANWSSVFWPG